MNQAMTEEQRIAICKTAIGQIYTVLRATPEDWRNFLPVARNGIAHLDSATFVQQPSRTGEQARVIAVL
jgi:hypothetical protein